MAHEIGSRSRPLFLLPLVAATGIFLGLELSTEPVDQVSNRPVPTAREQSRHPSMSRWRLLLSTQLCTLFVGCAGVSSSEGGRQSSAASGETSGIVGASGGSAASSASTVATSGATSSVAETTGGGVGTTGASGSGSTATGGAGNATGSQNTGSSDSGPSAAEGGSSGAGVDASRPDGSVPGASTCAGVISKFCDDFEHQAAGLPPIGDFSVGATAGAIVVFFFKQKTAYEMIW